MAVKLTPDNLEENGYALHTCLPHHELVTFVKGYFFKINLVIVFYWIFNFFMIGTAVFLLWQSEKTGANVLKMLTGLPAFFLIIPLHELIHGVGYKLAHAPVVTYKAIWRQLVFYAMADRFVAEKSAFVMLAIAPFLLINGLLIYLFTVLPESWSWVVYGCLIMHTAGCSGDFALISFFYEFWDKDPVTFDDVAGQRSYFYVKKS